MTVTIQTDGFFVLGELPNDELYRCLICHNIPESVYVDLFVPDAADIPASLAASITKTIAVPYRLCPHCFKAKRDPSQIRRLMLEKLNDIKEAL